MSLSKRAEAWAIASFVAASLPVFFFFAPVEGSKLVFPLAGLAVWVLVFFSGLWMVRLAEKDRPLSGRRAAVWLIGSFVPLFSFCVLLVLALRS
ncbi:MAG TPA: hypothetical protein VGE01_01385 [Fimbriimonas sp.]